MPGDLEVRRRRAAYRSWHRGTREMDLLLGRYADAELERMDGPRLQTFERLLALPDPDLHRWILEPELAGATEFAVLVAALNAFHLGQAAP